MIDEQRGSLSDEDIKALHRFAKSPLARPLFVALATVFVSAASGAGGWVAAKIDVKSDVSKLSGKFDVLTGSVNVLTSHTQGLEASVKAMSDEPNGKLPRIERQQIRMRHEIAVSTGAALAYESAKHQKAKLAAGEMMAKAYDNVLKDDDETSPSAALQQVIKTIAMPQE